MKRIVALVSVAFILAVLFVWVPTSVPHNTQQQKNQTVANYNNQKEPDSQESILAEEKYEEKTLIEKSTDAKKNNLPVTKDKNPTCTLIVKCDTILNNLDKLNEQKTDIIPQDGVIYYSKAVTFFDGESVFNVLSREMKQNKIHFEFEITPIFDTAYIKGIANIYEFDCGELSGWIYKVNGQTPGVGCSLYPVSDGDNIEIMYTCEMGKDLE